ncbi:patatin-like phospholipase family protein [Bradyrhizobium sp. STM 3562]|uniref:patatin-like phospholipase family protein n=1 Tax=Bradyrhizobium sp. STM 3562 TaxID=578924 RepID=UPI00388F2777
MSTSPQMIAITFSGGLGLASYHAGVYEAFTRQSLPLHWVTGSSAGAVTAALIAGNPVADRLACLKAFWRCPPTDRADTDWWRHLYGWMAAIETRLAGSAGFFRPRFPDIDPFRFRSFYDLAPMRERLSSLVDFGRLNGGEPRISIAATDIESGEPVIFDSVQDKLEMDHLLASCGYLPEFAPVEVGGRLLGDGGLSINAPFDPILNAQVDGDLLLYVIDLYPRDGDRPCSLEATIERKGDLTFANQTLVRLEYLAEMRALRKSLRQLTDAKDRIILLSYRPGMEEPGPEKSFELSASGFAQRWRTGRLDMEYAQTLQPKQGITKVRRPGKSSSRA